MPQFRTHGYGNYMIDDPTIHFIWQAKDRLAQLTGVPRIFQRVIYQGKPLPNETTLNSMSEGTAHVCFSGKFYHNLYCKF